MSNNAAARWLRSDLEAPAFTRGSLTFNLRPPRRARSWKPPRLRGGASPSPSVPGAVRAAEAPAFTRGSVTFPLRSRRARTPEAPAFTRGSVTFPLRSRRARTPEAPAFTRGSVTFPLRARRRARCGSPRVYAPRASPSPYVPGAVRAAEAPAFTQKEAQVHPAPLTRQSIAGQLAHHGVRSARDWARLTLAEFQASRAKSDGARAAAVG